MSHIHPRLRAEREALPDPTGLGEAIGRRRDARHETLRRVDLEFFGRPYLSEQAREFAQRAALAREELYRDIRVTLEIGPYTGEDWLGRRLDDGLRHFEGRTRLATPETLATMRRDVLGEP